MDDRALLLLVLGGFGAFWLYRRKHRSSGRMDWEGLRSVGALDPALRVADPKLGARAMSEGVGSKRVFT